MQQKLIRSTRRRRRSARRPGYVLVLFAMLLFALMGLAALVIDIGFARLTQRQMQTAVDAAALEGLRYRDWIPDAWLDDPATVEELEALAEQTMPTSEQTPNAPDWMAWRDRVRRGLASQRVAEIFDDNLNVADGDSVRQFGAGPKLDFADGIALNDGFKASQKMSIPAQRSYKPTLAKNFGNELKGDLVEGTRDPMDPDFATSEFELGRKENADYERNGFITSAGNGEYFLARMRRTNETFDPAIADSTGGTVPYMFGRGTMMPSRYKADGISVWAAAIAEARPVMSLGARTDDDSHRGTFAVSRELWAAILKEQTAQEAIDMPREFLTVIDSVGSVRLVRKSTNAPTMDLGQAIYIDTSKIHVIGGDAYEIGPQVSAAAGTWFVPIYTTLGDGMKRVIGFGCVFIDKDTFEITKRLNQIASENASAVLTQKLEPVGDELDEVLECFRVHSIAADGLLVPALAR